MDISDLNCLRVSTPRGSYLTPPPFGVGAHPDARTASKPTACGTVGRQFSVEHHFSARAVHFGGGVVDGGGTDPPVSADEDPLMGHLDQNAVAGKAVGCK